MIGIGTLVNVAAIIVGTVIGLLFKNGLPERIQKVIFTAVGVAVIFIGILGVVENAGNAMMLVLSLVLGAVVGELIDFESKFEKLGEKLKAKFVKPGSSSSETFVEGFVSATLIFCVGAMAIVGSLNDGLLHDPSMLYTKAILDGITSIVLASALGVGVIFAAIPVLVYQGLITVLAALLSSFFNDALIQSMSFVGNAIIFCIGINFLFPKKIKVGNLFPAMFMPILLQFFIK